jgi:hypothetical protein
MFHLLIFLTREKEMVIGRATASKLLDPIVRPIKEKTSVLKVLYLLFLIIAY